MPATSPGGPLARLLASVVRFGAHLVGHGSAWQRVTMRVPPRAFGPGSHQPFARYFEGKSSVSVTSIDDIVAWLQGCRYVTDLELFHKRDFWQHPRMFERLRRGDCEDFALWAWRKLAELGIDAEFCVGRVICDDRPESSRQHAWVVYRVDGTAFLFEPAARTRSRMIRRLVDAMGEYVPYFSVNYRLDTNAFVGCTFDSRQDSLGPSDPTFAV